MSLFIEDGYTVRRTIPAQRGLHPEVLVEYRPALARKRHELARKFELGDPAKVAAFEDELIEAHVLTLNGEPVKGRAGRIVPTLRKAVLDAVLGYEGADEEADAKN